MALAALPCTGNAYDVVKSEPGAKTAIVSYGIEVAEALDAAELLQEAGIAADVYKMVVINPIEQQLVDDLCRYDRILFAEEGIASGGIGEHLLVKLFAAGFRGEYLHAALPETGIDHAQTDELRAMYGIDAKGLAARLSAQGGAGARHEA